MRMQLPERHPARKAALSVALGTTLAASIGLTACADARRPAPDGSDAPISGSGEDRGRQNADGPGDGGITEPLEVYGPADPAPNDGDGADDGPANADDAGNAGDGEDGGFDAPDDPFEVAVLYGVIDPMD